MGSCVSIYECDYLFNILRSSSLSPQSVSFLKMSQCNGGNQYIPHVCCARNDDALLLSPNAATAAADLAPETIAFETSNENFDDTIIYKSSTGLLPQQSECGRESIENRIYSGVVSCAD